MKGPNQKIMGRTTKITSQTRLLAVLGHPVRHSLSPLMHNAALEALGLDAVYLALDTPPEDLPEALRLLPVLGFSGLNLTIPLKEAALKCPIRLDPSAQTMQAVNTIVFDDHGAVGHNTDGRGFARAVREAFDFDFRSKTVMVLGVGGAGRAVALTAALEGAARVWPANRTPDRAFVLANEIRGMSPDVQVESMSLADASARSEEADLIVQATSVGMKPGDPLLLPAATFSPRQCVYDLIYTQPETPIMRAARKAGARVANGLGMLVHQGALALEMWTGRTAPIEVMKQALEKAVKFP